MTHNFAYYKKLQGFHGCADRKAAEIYKIQTEILNDFDNTLDAEDVTINGTASKLLVIKQSDENIKKIKSRPGEPFYLGDLVTWLSTNWLVDKIDADNRINTHGKMRRCNAQLNWLDQAGTVQTRYGYCDDATKYDDGESRGQQLRTGEFQIKVLLPMDADTVKINRGKRFLIDASTFVRDIEEGGEHPTAFKVTRRNVITGSHGGHGYIELTMTETAYSHETDNPYLMIADYYDKSDVFTVAIANAETPLLLESEDTYQLTFSATKNGAAYPSASVLFYSSDTNVATVSAAGLVTAVDTGHCTITATAGSAHTEISVSVDEEALAAEIWLIKPDQSSDILYGTSKTYEVKIFENGEPSTETYTATITGDSGITASVVSGGVKVTVADDEDLIGEEFVLTVECEALSLTSTLNLSVRGWV